MLCRLCLIESTDNSVPLFNSDEQNNESALLKLITKYFHMELSPQDAVSTSICNRCCKHLYEFHEFWKFVDEQQNRLREKIKDKQILVEQEIDYPITNDADEEPQVDVNFLYPDEEKIDVKTEPEPVTNSLDYDDYNNTDVPDIRSDSSDDDTPLAKRLKTSVQNVKKRCKKAKIAKKSSTKKPSTKKITTMREYRSNGFASRARNAEIIQSFMPIIECGICKNEVKSFGELKQHFEQLHEDQAAYLICCGTKFRRASDFVVHIDRHKNPDASTCDICNKVVFSASYLLAHKLRRHGVKNKSTYSCEICNKIFTSQKCLSNHLSKNDHITSYPCNICEKSFVNKNSLVKHIESIHENKFSHVCDFCGKKFKFKPSFEKHVNEHMGIVPPTVQCQVCGEWLKNTETLRTHMFKHNGSANLCKFCNKRCVSRTALYRHIAYAHRLKKELKCTFCDKTFKEPRNLDEHVAIHTGAQLYSCPHCSKECRSRSNMYVHVKRYHPTEWINQKMKRSHDPQFKEPANTSYTENAGIDLSNN